MDQIGFDNELRWILLLIAFKNENVNRLKEGYFRSLFHQQELKRSIIQSILLPCITNSINIFEYHISIQTKYDKLIKLLLMVKHFQQGNVLNIKNAAIFHVCCSFTIFRSICIRQQNICTQILQENIGFCYYFCYIITPRKAFFWIQ